MHISPEERDSFYKTVYARRDTRSEFLADPIPEDVLMRVLYAAHHAPSVGFMQPWDFILVNDLDVRKKIKQGFEVAHQEAADMFLGQRREMYKSFKLEGITEAPMGICITCDRNRAGRVVLGRTAQQEMDLYSSVCAVQNLWLAARAENLGIGWVSIIHPQALKNALKIPEEIVPIAYLCIGYVSEFKEKPELEESGWQPRLHLPSLLHYDKW